MPAKNAPKKKLSVLKRNRQNETRRLRNNSVDSEIKTYAKKLLAAIITGNKDEVAATLLKATSVIDTASSKGVLHRNTASRKISRLAKKADSVLRPAAA